MKIQVHKKIKTKLAASIILLFKANPQRTEFPANAKSARVINESVLIITPHD
jgi:hypothetical protein